jgi:hypothetical protein
VNGEPGSPYANQIPPSAFDGTEGMMLSHTLRKHHNKEYGCRKKWLAVSVQSCNGGVQVVKILMMLTKDNI